VARKIRVAVIGAGLGGLAAACALRQHGIEVAVYERAAQLGEVGAGIQLAPNAVKVLRALGLEAELRAVGSEPSSFASLAWDDARLRFREPMKGPYTAQYGAPT
jgi:salicylate hydroxylase